MQGVILFLFYIGFLVASAAGFAQHIITTVKNEQLLLLVGGIIFPPLGVIHGWIVWIF